MSVTSPVTRVVRISAWDSFVISAFCRPIVKRSVTVIGT